MRRLTDNMQKALMTVSYCGSTTQSIAETFSWTRHKARGILERLVKRGHLTKKTYLAADGFPQETLYRPN